MIAAAAGAASASAVFAPATDATTAFTKLIKFHGKLYFGGMSYRSLVKSIPAYMDRRQSWTIVDDRREF